LKLDRCAVWFCCCWIAVDSEFIVSCRELHPHVLWCWISGSWLRSLNLCMKCIVLAHSVSTSFPLIKLNDSLSFLWHIPTSLHWTLWSACLRCIKHQDTASLRSLRPAYHL
jgi:hypothetical protein